MRIHIVGRLRKLEGVKEVYQVYGVYDIVAQVESYNGKGERNNNMET